MNAAYLYLSFLNIYYHFFLIEIVPHHQSTSSTSFSSRPSFPRGSQGFSVFFSQCLIASNFVLSLLRLWWLIAQSVALLVSLQQLFILAFDCSGLSCDRC